MVPTMLARPRAHCCRYQNIGSWPYTRARAHNGTLNLRRNSPASFTSAVRAHRYGITKEGRTE